MQHTYRYIAVYLLLVLFSTSSLADVERFRIAGIITFGTTDWRAIVELPDGEQQLVTMGQKIGDATVVDISQEGVTLQFPGGKKLMQLSQGDYVTVLDEAQAMSEMPTRHRINDAGIVASDFSKVIEKRLTPELLERVRGLEDLDRLPVSARIVSYSYLGEPEIDQMPIDSLEMGIDVLQDAIVTGKELRVTVQGDESLTNFYVMPRHPE